MTSSNGNIGAGRGQRWVGTVISGRYRVQSLIAVGGMAEVYLAEHVHIKKLFALKILQRTAEGFDDLAARFEHEAIAGAHIDHPHVATATDFGWLDDGSCFVAMEYVEGVTLSTIIRRGPLPAARARRIVRQLAAALAACHELGVLHRDLKPGNIMVDEARGDHVKLIDFGLARVPVARVSRMVLPVAHDLEDEPTRRIAFRGVVFGTVTYMPPEIALGMDAIDERSDLYALGIVLYEMLAGKPPYELRDPATTLLNKREPPPPIRDRAPGVQVSAELERIAAQLAAPAPTDRFQNARALLAALDVETAIASGDQGWLRASSTLRVIPGVFMATSQLVGTGSRTKKLALLAVATGAVGLSFWLSHRNLTVHEPVVPASHGIAEVTEQLMVEAPAQSAASAAATATVTATPSAAMLAARFVDAHRRGRVVHATRALMILVAEAPSALAEPETRKRAGALASILDLGDNGDGAALFTSLIAAGAPGFDVLYEVVSARGGTAAADRAKAILARPELRTRMSPALRIALELREARCSAKPKLFARAAEDGDVRTRIYLNQLRSHRCDPRIGQCCFHANRELEDVVRALRKKAEAERP